MHAITPDVAVIWIIVLLPSVFDCNWKVCNGNDVLVIDTLNKCAWFGMVRVISACAAAACTSESTFGVVWANIDWNSVKSKHLSRFDLLVLSQIWIKSQQ